MKKYLFFTLIALAMLSCNGKPKMSDAELDAQAEAQVDSMLEAAKLEEMGNSFRWAYTTDKDEMTDAPVQLANITSQDVAELEFPYEGGTFLTLWIRKNGNQSSAYIISSNGQLHDDYDHPTLTVRFDDEPPMNFDVSESSDNDPTIRFISSTDKFITKLKTAKKVKIQAQYYDNGIHIFNFDTKGFKWK